MNNRLSDRLLLVVLLLSLCHSHVLAQQEPAKSSVANMPRIGDNVCRYQVTYISPGQSGADQVWDLRNLEFADDYDNLLFTCDSDSITVILSDSRSIMRLAPSEDTLFCLGYETPLRSMNYSPSLPFLTFPIEYGSRLVTPYHGLGSYCQRYILEAEGTLDSEIDASGVIYMNDDDTIRNVLRLHQIVSAGIKQYLPEDTIFENDNVKQRVEDRCLWFARGYRYPILETSSITIYDNLEPVSYQQISYCTLPSDQRRLNDDVNKQILEEDSLLLVQASQPPIIHYTVSMDGNYISVNYSLDADATINAIVCDRLGMVYRRESTHGQAGTDGVLRLNASGLRSGVYVLYLNVNGQVYNEKIEI